MSEPAGAKVVEIARGRPKPDTRDVAALLGGVKLFDDLDHDELAELARGVRFLELAPGEILWEQASPYEGLYVLLSGDAQVCRRLPGERELELARLGPGEVMGELPMLGGGTHSATVRALGPCSLLFLSRAGFEARSALGHTGALKIRSRIVAIACHRLRRAYAQVAATGEPAAPHEHAGPDKTPVEPMPTALPQRGYLSRLALFRGLDADLVTEVLDSGQALYVPAGHAVQRQDEGSARCYVTLNGAVEDVVSRGRGSVLRVGFAGPGRSFGYLGLLDGAPAPVSSVTRERCVLLAIDRDDFITLTSTRSARSRAFAAAIEADLIMSLQIANRARSHMAAEVQA
jgi:CRP-like cAMP-binding protein